MVYSMDVSPDGSQLAVGLGDANVAIFDVATHVRTHTLEGHSSFVSQV
jgi:WD40 repeat protein